MLIVFILLVVIILLITAFLFGISFGIVASSISLDTSLENYGTSKEIESFKDIFRHFYDKKIKHNVIELYKKEVKNNSKEF